MKCEKIYAIIKLLHRGALNGQDKKYRKNILIVIFHAFHYIIKESVSQRTEEKLVEHW